MAFELRFSATATKQLRNLDRSTASRIVDYLEAVAVLDAPFARGKGLTGEFRGVWRYRIGDYRVLCDVDRHHLVILTLEVSHRSKSYQSP